MNEVAKRYSIYKQIHDSCMSNTGHERIKKNGKQTNSLEVSATSN